jgi:hypothetical protein
MDGSLMRSAIGCAIACGAFVAGPLSLGAAVAQAGLLGVGGGGDGVDVLGIDVIGGNSSKSGSGGTAGRLNAVSTAPSARSVVIRTEPSTAQPDSSAVPAAFIAPSEQPAAVALGSHYVESVPQAPPPAAPAPVPVTVPLTVMPPAAPALDVPAPLGLPVTTANQPAPIGRMGPAHSFAPPTKIPDSFRVGYAEYLRAATTTDLLAAALPGAAGIAGFTIIGAFAGYRQAKAVQKALLAPVPTRILM